MLPMHSWTPLGDYVDPFNQASSQAHVPLVAVTPSDMPLKPPLPTSFTASASPLAWSSKPRLPGVVVLKWASARSALEGSVVAPTHTASQSLSQIPLSSAPRPRHVPRPQPQSPSTASSITWLSTKRTPHSNSRKSSPHIERASSYLLLLAC